MVESFGLAQRMTLPAAIPAGERNSTLFRLAKSAAGKGVPEAAQLRKAWQVNADRCHPPLSDGEVRQLVANAYTARGGGAVTFPLAVMDSPEVDALGDAERTLLLVARSQEHTAELQSLLRL